MTHLLREKKADVSTMSAFFLFGMERNKGPVFPFHGHPLPAGAIWHENCIFRDSASGNVIPGKN